MTRLRVFLPQLFPALVIASAAACGGEDTGREARELELMCHAPSDPIADADWTCGETRVAECGAVTTLHIEQPEDTACDALDWPYDVEFEPGTHEIVVREDEVAICTAELEVVDTTPPIVRPLEMDMWPPNHRMVEVTAFECARPEDTCDDDLDVRITWVTSNEPMNDSGDGNTELDIDADCDRVAVRAERAGPGVGRVYEVGFVVTDDDDNETEGTCMLYVPHDRGAHTVLPGTDQMAYRIDLPETCGEID